LPTHRRHRTAHLHGYASRTQVQRDPPDATFSRLRPLFTCQRSVASPLSARPRIVSRPRSNASESSPAFAKKSAADRPCAVAGPFQPSPAGHDTCRPAE
jgi:hypothetical protein